MTATLSATPAVTAPDAGASVVKHHPNRWRMHRAGIVNVWYYYDETFEFSGGRMLLRGTNGAGKSRALEMLLPFVLDGDRRRMDATLSNMITLNDVMKHGAKEQTNRVGYLWVELVRTSDEDEAADELEYLTVGAMVRWSSTTAKAADPLYFITPLRVGSALPLINADRQPLSKDKLTELVGADHLTDTAEVHRERVGAAVFSLRGLMAKERYAGLLQLLYTLRSPDVGNRIEKGRLPTILSEALPPLSEDSLKAAGERLDSLSETRAAQQSLEIARVQVDTFLGVYARYAAATLTGTAAATRTAAAVAADAASDQARTATRRDALARERSAKTAAVIELEQLEKELGATITGIKALPAYAAGADIDNLAAAVRAQAATAETSLGRAHDARQVEADAAERLDALADEVTTAATAAATDRDKAARLLVGSKLSVDTLPPTITATTEAGPLVSHPVRLTLNGEPEPVDRPAPRVLTVTPTDLNDPIAATGELATVARRRAGQANNRRTTAQQLRTERASVERAEQRADEAHARAEEAAATHAARADARDQGARDLTTGWRAWTASTETATLLGDVDWTSTAVGPLLADVEALCGDVDDAHPTSDGPPTLRHLSQAAHEAARAARAALAGRAAKLQTAEEADRGDRAKLDDEGLQLRAARDPAPAAAPWARPLPADTVPLWRAVDFAAQVPDADRAGLEAALLSAGLLGAGVAADGSVRASDGQVLLSAAAPTAPVPLSAVLIPDPAAEVSPDLVAAVLARVGLGAHSHSTWVDVDGSWGNGPLHGKHTTAAAAHIGAVARAAARTARLAEIAAELTSLDARAQDRKTQREAVDTADAALTAHLDSTPGSDALAGARGAAVETAKYARDADTAARKLGTIATAARTAWKAAEASHHASCDHLGLPRDEEALSEVKTAAETAAGACTAAARTLADLRGRAAKHQAEATKLAGTSRDRARAEQGADAAWDVWHEKAAEFEAMRDALGKDADQVRADLTAAESEHAAATADLTRSRKETELLVEQAVRADGDAEVAAAVASTTHRLMVEALAILAEQVSLPGLVAAATGDMDIDLGPACTPAAGQQLTPALVQRAATAVTAKVRATKAAITDETTLVKAQQVLDREVAGTYDVHVTMNAGVRLVELSDTDGRLPVAAAAVKLASQVEHGKAAFTAREHEVFTEFVLEGVGGELGHRLKQAKNLIADMNASLAGISTSHGISVRLKWDLTDAPGSPIARIRDLVAADTKVRPLAQSDELIGLLKDRVREQFDLDPTAGYATHLKNALDYRLWHRIEVTVLGPDPGQRRSMGTRTRLSQGETRFVSYVALFAAADAYMSGLPDTVRALRLILLDDAFAKVDNQTIGELMGLLVRLDLDFVLTGHALWGTYAQVPSLDVYEVCREEGSPAVTMHVHWDGRTRHHNLRVAR